MQGDFTPAELSTGWLYFGWTSWFDCRWTVFLVTPLMKYFDESTIRLTVLLEYLDHTFSICGCLLIYNSLIFSPIFLSFDKGSFLCLVCFYSNFQRIPPCSLCDISWNSWFFDCAKLIVQFYQDWVKLYVSYCRHDRILTPLLYV